MLGNNSPMYIDVQYCPRAPQGLPEGSVATTDPSVIQSEAHVDFWDVLVKQK